MLHRQYQHDWRHTPISIPLMWGISPRYWIKIMSTMVSPRWCDMHDLKIRINSLIHCLSLKQGWRYRYQTHMLVALSLKILKSSYQACWDGSSSIACLGWPVKTGNSPSWECALLAKPRNGTCAMSNHLHRQSRHGTWRPQSSASNAGSCLC
jgi:hypothetical protein